ncbi:MAG: carbohydrate ABC transporter substrate-binding protein, partial [Ruminococcus sp.]|nr:carbohydrate ABC transporter substrate-binding protein [Ruminococcus sp.]
MNTLKRTLALVATLAMASTAFASCGSDDSSSSSSKADEATKAADEATTAEAGNDTTEAPADTTEAPAPSGTGNSTELGEVTLKTGGDQFTVAAWNSDDAPALIDLWAANGGDKSKVNFINFDCGGGKASEKYDALFASGDDLDVYFAEADWALKYINDDTRTAPLEALGFSEDNFADT